MRQYGLGAVEGYFYPESILALRRIFDKASRKIITQEEKARLKNELSEIISREAHHEMHVVSISPSEDNYICWIVNDYKFVLMNLNGIIVLAQSPFIWEGEMIIHSIRWIEKDNLLLFRLHMFADNAISNCICHYSNDDDEFLYQSPYVESDIDFYSAGSR